MAPATSVPMRPTMSETRAPWISRLRMSRPWKSVPSGASVLPPSIQNGGANIVAPCTGSVGSWGAMRSAKSATNARPPRRTAGTSGACRARRCAAPWARGRSPAMVAMRLPREPDARIDERVENIDDQVDGDDHEAGHDHDALHQRDIPLEDALVEQPPDARP